MFLVSQLSTTTKSTGLGQLVEGMYRTVREVMVRVKVEI